MRKFNNWRVYSQVHQMAVENGVPFDDNDYVMGGKLVKLGSDEHGFALYNTDDGTFTGQTPEGIPFTSLSDEYDGHDWFDALLAFFYYE